MDSCGRTNSEYDKFLSCPLKPVLSFPIDRDGDLGVARGLIRKEDLRGAGHRVKAGSDPWRSCRRMANYLLRVSDIARQSLKLGNRRRRNPGHEFFRGQSLLQEAQNRLNEYTILDQRQIG